MNKNILCAVLAAAVLAGCGDDKAATATIEGSVEVFSIGTKVSGATVEVSNFDQSLGITATSGAGGALSIQGIPKGTDVTLAVLTSDSYLGKPTYTFHVGGTPIQSDLTGRTFYLVNDLLAKTMLGFLKASGVPAGVGVVAGSVVRVVDEEEKGIFGTKVTVDPALSPIYFKGSLPDLEAKSSDAGGRFIFFGLPMGKATITATGSDGSSLGTSTVAVYDQSVSLVTIYAQ